MTPAIGVRLRNDAGITAACIRSEQAVVCSDAARDERVNSAACTGLGITSIVVVPIRNGGTLVGIIEALSRHAHAFAAPEQAVLERIAQKIGESTLGQACPMAADATASPDFAALMSLIEDEDKEPVPAAAGQSPRDVVPDESDQQRPRMKFAAISAPLAIGVLFLVALAMILARVGMRPAGEAQTPPGTTLPLRRTAFLEPSPVVPGHTNGSPVTIQLRALRSAGSSLRQLEASARAGDASAQARLASALARGAGITADPVSAEAWYIVAHLAGNKEAADGMRLLSRRLSDPQTAAVREKLATMYGNGIGVKRDPVAAYSWLNLAEAAGAQGVGPRKQRLAGQMSPKQIDEANVRAQLWLKQHHQLIAQDRNN